MPTSRVVKFKSEPCTRCGSAQTVVNGAWLREVRKLAGLSLREMSRRVGVSAPYLCDIERNRRNCLPAMRDAYENLTSFGEMKWPKSK